MALALDVIGERWTILMLRDLLRHGPRRFRDFEESLTGVAPNTLSARLKAMETAFSMQSAASDAFDVRREPQKVRDEYGTTHFANACLLARRLVERGVRFVQVYYGNGQPWDTHRDHNALTRKLCQDIDRPIAALLTDLKRRGLLDDTLVIWGGEFGRTSTSESGDGRDHNHWGFTTWLAGGGARGGMAYGATELGPGYLNYAAFSQFLHPLANDPDLDPPDLTAGGRLVLCNIRPEGDQVLEVIDLGRQLGIGRNRGEDDPDGGWGGVLARLKPPKPSAGGAVAVRPPPPEPEG